MEAERFDGLTRALRPGSPTRRTLTTSLFALAVVANARIGLGPISDVAVAKKGKKKNCKKAKPEPTCPGACPDDCVVCAARHAGTPLCGQNAAWNCDHVCTSDSDCIGKVIVGFAVPYCITGYTASGGPFTHLPCGGTSHCAGFAACV